MVNREIRVLGFYVVGHLLSPLAHPLILLSEYIYVLLASHRGIARGLSANLVRPALHAGIAIAHARARRPEGHIKENSVGRAIIKQLVYLRFGKLKIFGVIGTKQTVAR